MKISYWYGRRHYPPNIHNEAEYEVLLDGIGKGYTGHIANEFEKTGIKSLEEGCTVDSTADRDLACWHEIKKHFLRKGDTILDVGTNMGTMCFRMKHEGYEPTGIEQSADIVNYTNSIIKPQLSRENWQAIEFISARESEILNLFGEKSFDVIFTKHVLEHVPNVVETLQMWRKVARKGICGIVPIEDKEECWLPGRHTYRFSEKVLRKLLEEQGYKNIGICSYVGDSIVDGKFYRESKSAGYWANL